MNKITFIFIYTIIISGYLTTSAFGRSPSIQLVSNNFVLRDSNGKIVYGYTNNKDNLIKVLIFAGLISTTATLGWYLSGYRRSTSHAISYGHSHRTLLNRVNPKLRRQLLRLVNDPKTAERLLRGIQNHGDRSADWLAQKAIYDLQRGR